MTKRNSNHNRWMDLCFVAISIALAFALTALVDRTIAEHFRQSANPDRGRIFGLECAVLLLIFTPVAAAEILRFSRAIRTGKTLEIDVLRNVLNALVALAGSLAVFLAYVWCDTHLKV